MPVKAGSPTVELQHERASSRSVAKEVYKKHRKGYASDFSIGKDFQAFVYDEKCIGCTQCVDSCPVDAIQMIPSLITLRSRTIKSWKSFIIEPACVGCRKCAVDCPVNAIAMLDRDPGWKERNDSYLAKKKKDEERRKAELESRQAAIADGSYFLQKESSLAGIGGGDTSAAAVGVTEVGASDGIATAAAGAAAGADDDRIWPVYNVGKCTGQKACAEACPTGTISLGTFDRGELPTFTLETCINCSACADSCPTGAIEMLKGRPKVDAAHVLS